MTKYIDFALIGEPVVHGDVHYEDLKRLPAADVVEVRHGWWIDITKDSGHPLYKCNECGDLQLEESYYCPNCGAKMINEDEEMSKVFEMEMAYAEYLND